MTLTYLNYITVKGIAFWKMLHVKTFSPRPYAETVINKRDTEDILYYTGRFIYIKTVNLIILASTIFVVPFTLTMHHCVYKIYKQV